MIGYGTDRVDFAFEGTIEDVMADDKLLRHILVNLLSNAVKYSPREMRVEFLLRVHPDTGMYFRISDHGIGIPAEELPRLFEVFHRASNVGNVQGTGLGLSIVKRSVELHGGRISVDSKEGIGTTFIVELPSSSGSI